MRVRRLQAALILAAAVSAAAPSDVAAQIPANQDSVWGAALARLSAGRTIRLHDVDRGRIVGRFRSATPATLVLDVDTSATALSRAGLDSLGVRGNAARTGALVGAAGGAVLGALIGALIPRWHRRIP